MKKGFIAATIAVITLLVFSSCSAEMSALTSPSETTLPHMTAPPETTITPDENKGTAPPSSVDTPYQEKATTSPSLDVEKPLLTLSTLEEYKAFETAIGEKNGIVKYEDIQELGDFNFLVFLSDATYLSDYSYYMYSLVDNTGMLLNLYIAPQGKLETSSQRQLSISDSKNLWKRDASETGYIIYNNMRYAYLQGYISTISWVADGRTYTLDPEKPQNYQHSETSFLSKLLDSRTAENALASMGMQLDTVVE